MMITDMKELKERLMLYFTERYDIVTKLKFNTPHETMKYHNNMLKIKTMEKVILPDYDDKEVTLLIVFVGGDAGITVPKFVLEKNEENLHIKIKQHVIKEYINYLQSHINYLDKCFVKEVEKCVDELSGIEPNSDKVVIEVDQYNTECVKNNILILHEKFADYADELKNKFPDNVIVSTLSHTPFLTILNLLEGSYAIKSTDEFFMCLVKGDSSYNDFIVPKFLCTDMETLNELSYELFKEYVLYKGIDEWKLYVEDYNEKSAYVKELEKLL